MRSFSFDLQLRRIVNCLDLRYFLLDQLVSFLPAELPIVNRQQPLGTWQVPVLEPPFRIEDAVVVHLMS